MALGSPDYVLTEQGGTFRIQYCSFICWTIKTASERKKPDVENGLSSGFFYTCIADREVKVISTFSQPGELMPG